MTDSSSQPPNDLHAVVDALRDNLEDEAATTSQRELAAAGLLVALLGVVAWLWFNLAGPATPAAERLLLKVRQTTPPGAESWIAPALRSALKVRLEAGGAARVYAEEYDSELMGGPVLPNPATANSGFLLQGQFWELDVTLRSAENNAGSVLLDYRLAHPDGAQHTGTLNGRTDMLADLATRSDAELRSKLNLAPPPSTQPTNAQREMPESPRAQRLLYSAQTLLSRQQFRRALEQLHKANQIEPDHPMILTSLANAYSGLGYEGEAQAQLTAAVENLRGLSRERQLSIRAAAHIARQEWADAQELLRALFLLFPNDLDYGLRLLRTQTAASDFSAAEETLAELRELPDGLGADPRIDLHAANADYANGDWAAGLVHAHAALDKAQRLKAEGLEAMARWWLNRLDDDRDEAHIRKAAELFRKHNNTDGEIACLTRMGTRARARGDLHSAERFYAQALDLARESGNESRLTTTLGTLAIVKDLQGQLGSGLALKQEVLELRRQRGNQTGIGISLENLGISNYKLGNVAAARRWFSEASEQFKRSNDAIGEAWAPWHEGRLLTLEGRLAEARVAMEQAQSNAITKPEGGYALHVRYELLLLDYLAGITAGNADNVHSDLETLHQDYVAAELLTDAALTRLLQARVAHHRGDALLSKRLAREAYDRFAAEGINDYRLQAATHLLRLGNTEYCAEILEEAPNTEHQPTGLLALAAAYECTEGTINLEQVKTRARERNLFEPLWLATHLQNSGAAAAMAQASGWGIRP